MIERYTEKAIKVLLFAQEEAFMAKHIKLYPEHILLGIMREGSGLSAKLLKASGVKVDQLREDIGKKQFKQAELQNSSETMPFSSAVKKILREAWYKVQSSGTYYVTPENLFLSLIADDGSSVKSLLEEYDVNLKKIKTSVEKVSKKIVKPIIHPEEAAGINNARIKAFDKIALTEENELKNLMDVAGEKIKDTKHEAYGTEQLFQALLEDNSSWFAELLRDEGVNLANFEEKLKNIDSRKDEYKENLPEFTPKAYKAMNRAHDIAKELGSTYIKPEHVLLGILKEDQGIACRILKELNVNTGSLYHKIINPIQREKPEILTIIKLAKEEAHQMEQNILGTEQILLGILGEGAGVGAQVLRNLGVTLKDARIEVKKHIGFGHNYSDSNEMMFTPRAKRVIALAWQKAKKTGKEKYSSEHLLLAITGEKESIAMRVLEDLGVDTLEIRQGILNEIRKSNAAAEFDE